MLLFLVVFSILIAPTISYFIDAGVRGEDTSIITGETWAHAGSIRLNILETDTPSYYRTHRSGPDFTYSIRGFKPQASYKVDLGFAEVWGSNCVTGTRIMNIEINGVAVREGLDVFREVGCFTAHVETFNTAADDTGVIEIRVYATKENAMISSINIVASSNDGSGSSSDDSSEESFAVAWTDRDEDENYVARHECAFVQAGSRFFMFGGRENAKQLDIYDYTSNSWSEGASLAKELNHFQAVEYEGLIWVINAFQSNYYPGERPAEHVHVFDPANNVWMLGPEVPIQRRRGSGGVQVHDGKFYVMGGNTVGHSGWCVPWTDEYDPSTGEWKVLPDAPRPRDHFHLAIVGNKMYAAGGRCTSRYSKFSDTVAEVDVFDFDSRTWAKSRLPDNLPSPRAGAAVAALDAKVIVMGGESGEQADAYDTVHELDTQTDKWTRVAPMNHPRHGTQAILSGRSLYIAGGSPVRGDGNQKNLEVYGEGKATGEPSTAGVLSVPDNIQVPVGIRKKVGIEHVSGNQGVFVQSLSLVGGSASDFILMTNATTPLLIRRGSTLEVSIEYTGKMDEVHTRLKLFFSGNTVMHVDVVGLNEAAGKVTTMTTASPTGLRSQPPTSLPSSLPSFQPTSEPSRPPTARPSPPPSTTNAPPPIDMIINAGANDENPSLFTGTTWTYKVFFDTEINGTSTPQYFRSHRSAENKLSYKVTGLKAGKEYEILVGFSEIWKDNCFMGKRVMDLAINGELVESNLDVFKEVGCYAALVKSYVVAANGAGRLDIDFSASVEHPMVSYIELKPTEAALAKQPSFRPSLSPSRQPSFRPSTQAQPILTSPASINMIIDAGSLNEDRTKFNGTTWTFGIPNSFDIANTNNPSLFRTHRSSRSFAYILDGLIPGQAVGVEMGWAEIWTDNCAIGKRVMSISVNGEIVNPAMDVYKEVGCEAAYIQKYTTHVDSEGKVVVLLSASVENAMLSYLRLTEPTSEIASLVLDAGAAGEDTSSLTGDTWTYGIPLDKDVGDTNFPTWGRTHRSGTTFTYLITELEAEAAYDLSLGFAEVWQNNCDIGKRVMTIKVNNVVMKDNLDVFREAGCNAAHIEIFATEADASGNLEITFDASIQNAMVSYIEVAKSRENTFRTTRSPTLPPSPTPSHPLLLFIDAGSSNEDTSIISEGTWEFSVPSNTNIRGTSTPQYFRSHRSSPRFTYIISGLDSREVYTVELGFAETWYKNCDIGKRVMRLSINNKIVSPEVDVYKEVGCDKAYIESFSASPTASGTIELLFEKIVENAMVSTIQIEKI